MAVELVQNTYVRFNGNEFSCKTFPEIWDVLKANEIEMPEDFKGRLIDDLFRNGCVRMKLNETIIEFYIR